MVNADQNVIIIWDAAYEMQYFIRRASLRRALTVGLACLWQATPSPDVRVLNQVANVAGFQATVLEANMFAPVVIRRTRPKE